MIVYFFYKFSCIFYKDDLNDDNILTGSLSEILKARRKQKEKKYLNFPKNVFLHSKNVDICFSFSKYSISCTAAICFKSARRLLY